MKKALKIIGGTLFTALLLVVLIGVAALYRAGGTALDAETESRATAAYNRSVAEDCRKDMKSHENCQARVMVDMATEGK